MLIDVDDQVRCIVKVSCKCGNGLDSPDLQHGWRVPMNRRPELAADMHDSCASSDPAALGQGCRCRLASACAARRRKALSGEAESPDKAILYLSRMAVINMAVADYQLLDSQSKLHLFLNEPSHGTMGNLETARLIILSYAPAGLGVPGCGWWGDRFHIPPAQLQDLVDAGRIAFLAASPYTPTVGYGVPLLAIGFFPTTRAHLDTFVAR